MNSDDSMTFSSARQRLISNALQILGLWAFAVAQPIFNLLSDNPVFLSVRAATSIEILISTAIIVCIGPLALLALEAVSYFTFRRFFLPLHVAFLAILSSAILSPMVARFAFLAASLVVITAVSGGVVFAMIYIRFQGFRNFLSWIAPIAVIFPAIFLLLKPISSMVFPAKIPRDLPSIVEQGRELPPIVWIIFDELPLVSLMDNGGNIDEVHYPNFSKLSKNSTWYKNTTTVSYETHRSVSGILTGKRHYDPKFVPTFSFAPNNVFTLLRDVYDFEVVETITNLFPTTAYHLSGGLRSTLSSVSSILVDVGVLYLHFVIPPEYSGKLPHISTKWGGFLRDTSEIGSKEIGFNELPANFRKYRKIRDRVFRKFVSRMKRRDRPAFYFHHAALPHRAFQFYPNGQRYYTLNSAGLKNPGARWSDDEFLVRLNYQRHLLQVRFVDKLVGEVIQRLESMGMWDETLIVITADHGASFIPGDRFRGITKTNYVDIIPVPLFIKAPNQTGGVVTNDNMETIDILPTVADILGIEIPWEMDGVSANDPLRKKEGKKVTKTGGVFPIDLDFSGSIRRKMAWFASGTITEMYGIGLHRDYVGKKLKEFRVGSATEFNYQLDYAKAWDNVNPHGGWLPGHLTGTIYSGDGETSQLDLVVSVNGVISATSRTTETTNGGMKFDVMVPPSVFRTGANDLKLFTVKEFDSKRLLRIEQRTN